MSLIHGAPLIVGVGVVVASAALLSSCLRLRSAVSFALATYLIAWAEVVVVTLALSSGRWVERWTLLTAFVVVGVGALAAWLATGRPAPPPIRAAARRGLRAAADPLVGLPLAIAGSALLYTLAVTLTTAQNDGDALVYELSRAAFWRQEHGIVPLGGADSRLDYSPPVAEIGDLVNLTLSGTDQLVGLTQWTAVLALALATYGIGRRLGLAVAPALWGASLVPVFPVVLIQSWSALTDVVFASFAVTAVYFGVGALGIELLPLGLAVGLAMSTKFLGPIFAPLFLLILAVAQPPRRWGRAGIAALAGAGLASLWYLRTLLETGGPVGNGGGGVQSLDLATITTTFLRLSGEIFDLSGGALGAESWVYLLAALLAVAAAAGSAETRRRPIWGLVLAAALIVVTRRLVVVPGEGYAYVGRRVAETFRAEDMVFPLANWKASELSSGATSWFGPVGALLVVGGLVVAVVEVRRRRLSRVALVLAAAPVVAVLLVSLTVAYERNEGRYFMAPMALCAATWGGFALRRRWVATAVLGVVFATTFLTLVHSLSKPLGLGILRSPAGPSVWSMPRWEQQGILRPLPAERDELLTIKLVEERVPEDASLGVSLAENSFVFPYFGPELRRTVVIVEDGEAVPAETDWLVVSPGQKALGCRDAWSRVRRGSHGWSAWRRVGPDTCDRVERLGAG